MLAPYVFVSNHLAVDLRDIVAIYYVSCRRNVDAAGWFVGLRNGTNFEVGLTDCEQLIEAWQNLHTVTVTS